MKKNTLQRVFILCAALIAAALLLGGCSAGTNGRAPAEDLDLTAMSGTMVYSQVYNMTTDPQSFIGKIIRLSGLFEYYEDTETDNVYFAALIPDATSCCAQGIEFVWAGEHDWPEDYPEYGTEITVRGRFETYMENGLEYIHLADAEVTW